MFAITMIAGPSAVILSEAKNLLFPYGVRIQLTAIQRNSILLTVPSPELQRDAKGV